MDTVRSNEVFMTTNQPAVDSITQEQQDEAGPYMCWKAHSRYCIYLMSAAFYGLLILAILICLRKGNLALTFVVFLFIFFPLALKVCWIKVNRWQARKDTLQENAEAFNRLTTRGTERTAAGQSGTYQSNDQTGVPYGNNRAIGRIPPLTDNTGGSSTDAPFSVVVRLPPPPCYTLANAGDLPPSYDEVVQLYGLPEGHRIDSDRQPSAAI